MSEQPRALPSALERLDEIAERMRDKRPCLFLDYDGTLTPIVARPELAVLSEALRDTLRRLARRAMVAVISGRDLQDVRERVGLSELYYAGSHGFDIAGPAGRRI
nr:trehalose-phosphatase [Gammaproteobacteria bacterium]NIR30345.1 trehalose-phosphatase [Gammaproteobacteria bacterium]NIR98189.1 trehalose-phosphatase [Gammaproteobacteria bacterium]NIT63856.1 trehalose-phosphatase [Gammaproteobacteria bacterium]NIV20860.1 trehalose-phosphatase [Gammaproteobacteria bacterium]